MAERRTRRVRKSATPRSKSSAGTPASKAQRTSRVKTDDIDSLVPKGLSGAFVKSKLREETVRKAGLKEPSDFEGEMPELPDDIDAVDHSDLSNLLLGFQSALATATWQASKAYIESDIAEEVYEYLRNNALLETNQSNDLKRRAEAENDDLVVTWKGRQKSAYHDYVSFRDLARTIEGKIKVLSRVGGFKDDENDGSDRTARSKQSKGAARGSARRRIRE